MTNSRGNEALADAGASCDQDILIFADESAIGQTQYLVLVLLARSGKADLLDHGLVAKAGVLDAALLFAVAAVVPFGADERGQKLVWCFLLWPANLQARGKSTRHAVQIHGHPGLVANDFAD